MSADGDAAETPFASPRLFLQALSDRLRRLDEDHAILVEAAAAVGARLGADHATFAECDATGARFALASEWPLRGIPPMAGPVLGSRLGEELLALLQSGEALRVDDVADDPRLDEGHRAVLREAGIGSGLAAPILRDGRPAAMLALQCEHSRAWTDAEAALAEAVAERAWAALERARALAALAAAESRQRFLLTLADALRDADDPDALIATTNRLLGEHLGALRVGYGEIDDTGTLLVLRDDWTNGVESNAGTFLLESYGSEGAEESRAGRTFVCADTANDPRVGPENRPAFERFGVRALIAVPLIRRGRYTAVLSVQAGAPRAWTPAEVALCEEVAARTWAVLERARAEAALREREEQLSTAIDGARLGTYDWDLVTGRGRWSDRAVEMLGAATASPTLADWSRNIRAEDQPLLADSLQQALAAGGAISAEYRVVDANGATRWIASRGRVITDAAGRPVRTAGVLVDVTERRVAEQRLAESEARLAAFLRHAPASMYLKDADGRYLLANAEIARRLGATPEALIGRTLAEVAQPDIAAHTEREEREVLAAGQPRTGEQSFELQGELVHALVTRFPVPGADGRAAGVGGVLIDISSQKRAEAELARSREALYQSEKLAALGSLLAGVSHELNNPLAVVAGQATLLEEDAAGTPHAARAAKIHRAADRCARIVQTFLAMARQKPPERRPTQVNEVLRAALDLTDYGLRTAGVRVDCRLAPGLPPLDADPDQLHQLFANLLINAQHALVGVAGERRLAVTSRREGGELLIEVADNGPGIPAEIRRRIFDPFFTTKPQGAGTGLGLSFALGVAQAHGGALELADAEGTGATFRVRLPVVEAAAEAPAADTPAAPRRGRVLVVDDEADVAELLAEMLEAQGWRVRQADGGAAALQLLQREAFDYILSDVRMPDVDGPALHAWLSTHQPRMAARIAFVTGDTLGPAAAFLDECGAPRVAKPFTPAALREALARLEAAT